MRAIPGRFAVTFRPALVSVILTACFMAPVFSVAGAEPEPTRPRVGLVLSGGGALGATHVGVLKVLEELRVPIDVISGTSMGAIVGGLYAAGYSAAELETLLREIDWVDIFEDRPARDQRPFRRKQDDFDYLVDVKLGFRDGAPRLPTGLLQGQKLTVKLGQLAARAGKVDSFDDLRIPFRAVAADVETGAPVVLGRGDLARAMRASMSLPGLFPPVFIDDRVLVDGGVANNLPMDVARAMGADILIVVDIPTVLKPREELDSAFAIIGQMVGVLIQQNARVQLSSLGPDDILIRPDLGDRTSADFPIIMEMVPPGEAAARRATPALRALAGLAAGGAVDPPRRTPAAPATDPPVLAFVDIDNRTDLAEGFIRARLGQRAGRPLDAARLDDGIAYLNGTGEFEQIDYRLVERDGETGLLVTVEEKDWAKNYFQFGLNLQSNFAGDAQFDLGTTLTFTGLNAYGGEWRSAVRIGETPLVSTEFFQPLDVTRTTFVRPRIGYRVRQVLGPGEGGSSAEYQTEIAQADWIAGVDIDTCCRLAAGTRHGFGNAELVTGVSSLRDFDFRTGQVFGIASIDTADSVGFPTRGTVGVVEIALSLPELGATSSFTKASLFGNWAGSWGRNTLVLGTELGTAVNDDLPLEESFQLGGFLSLSGLLEDQLSGSSLAFGRLLFYRELTGAAPQLFDLPVYAGASLEAGNVWDDHGDVSVGSLRYAASAFAGADTPLGPVYLGYGRILDGGDNAFYLFVGRPF